MAYTAWVAFLLCAVPLHGARIRMTPKVSAKVHKKPICAPDIVAETCTNMLGKPKDSAFFQDGGFITMPDVQVALSTSDGSVSGLWNILKLPEKTTCTNLCNAVKEYLQEVTVLPSNSDEGCYVANGGKEVRCGLDFSPSVVGQFVNPSRPFKPAADGATDVDEESEDPQKMLKEMVTKWRKKASKMRSSIVVRNTTEEYKKYLAGSGTLQYPFQTMAKQLARRFRFFPAAGHNMLRGHNSSLGASLVETDPPGIGGTTKERDLASERLSQAVAYLNLAMSHFSGDRADHLVTKYFGNSDAKVELLRVLNSVSGMLENVAFAFPPLATSSSGGMCEASVFAYVYPKSNSGSVKAKCDGLVPSSENEFCVANSAGELLYYLCPKFVNLDDISEQIQTMLHEGSHHFPAKTSDVCVNEFRFGNDQTEFKVVPWDEVVDESLGDMVWTSPPDDQPLEKFTHLPAYPDYGVLAQVWMKNKDLAVLKLSLKEDPSKGCENRAYQPTKCLDLARLAPFAAVRNADSIGYFIVEAVTAGAYDEHSCTQVSGGFCVGEQVCRTAADGSCAGPLGLVQYPGGGDDPANDASGAIMGDKVFLGTRRGTINYDMRPAHAYVKLLWEDTGETSDLKSVDRLSLEPEKVVVRLSGERYPVEIGHHALHRPLTLATATLGDKLFLDGRRGTINYDMRPAHNFVKMTWSDTGEESELISFDDLTLEEKKIEESVVVEEDPAEVENDKPLTVASATLGDILFLNGRPGAIISDLRPGHKYVRLTWSDTGKNSNLLDVERLTLEVKKVVRRPLTVDSAIMGDMLFLDGRSGIITYDMRPEHKFLKLTWSDTDEQSEIINVNDLSPLTVATATVGDTLYLDGRPGTMIYDMRPDHDFVRLEWTDTKQESGIISTGGLSLEKEP